MTADTVQRAPAIGTTLLSTGRTRYLRTRDPDQRSPAPFQHLHREIAEVDNMRLAVPGIVQVPAARSSSDRRIPTTSLSSRWAVSISSLKSGPKG